MTLDKKIAEEVETKVPWVPRFLDDYDCGKCSQEFARTQITSAYGVVSEQAYLALIHMYNGVVAAQGVIQDGHT